MSKRLVLMPNNLIGKSMMIHLKDGGTFNFKCVGHSTDNINGFDEKGLNLRIDLKDIEFALEA